MGQRLVIQLEENGNPLANAYYHWSAYTESAIDLINDVIEYLNDAPTKDGTFISFNEGNKFKATWALFMTGARFNDDEVREMQNVNVNMQDFRFVFDGTEVDRNKGLLFVTEKGMEDTIGWAESIVYVDIVTGDIDFGVMWSENTEDYVERMTYDGESPAIDDFPVLNCPEYPNYFDDSWNQFSNNVKHILSQHQYCAVSENRSTIYEFIC